MRSNLTSHQLTPSCSASRQKGDDFFIQNMAAAPFLPGFSQQKTGLFGVASATSSQDTISWA